MRKIDTVRFGTLEVEKESLLHFPQGIPGFFHLKEWFLVGEDDNPIKWLQSVGNGAVALPVALPRSVCPEYKARIAEEDLEDLGDEGEICSFVVVNIPSGAPWKSTVNLRAPIVINHRTRRGRQVISLNEEYSMRAPLFSEEEREVLVAQVAPGEDLGVAEEK